MLKNVSFRLLGNQKLFFCYKSAVKISLTNSIQKVYPLDIVIIMQQSNEKLK